MSKRLQTYKGFFLLRGYIPIFLLIVVSYCQLCFTERAIFMILSCQNIDKTFDGEHILDHVSFHLEEHDRAALIGVNGAGKSTILRIIVGELAPDEGDVSITKGKTIGYLAQYQDMEEDCTIYEEVRKSRQYLFDMEKEIHETEELMQTAEGDERARLLDRYTQLTHAFEMDNGYAAESEITGVLRGLGFTDEDYSRPLSTLSGGQKTRVVLGRLLLTKPDLLLLDEPTNHLDMSSVEWLEGYLRSYPGTVLIVSHDRYFLNRIVNRVIELENGKAMTFRGNYDDYSAAKSIVRRSQMQAYARQQAEIHHQEAVIRKLKQFNREKSIRRAESREKMLNKIERLDKPAGDPEDMHIRLVPSVESGNDVLTVTDVSKSFPGMPLFRDQSFAIKKGERVAIIGDNGTGKSTLLKIITGQVDPDSGDVVFGSHVHVGYYDQEQQLLHDDKTIFQEISDAYPTLDNTRIRTVLAAFLFTGDDVFKLIGALSGGERGRVSLAKLMLSESNFLILDEPTNHLDIGSKGILEDALCDYAGTVLFVSHDRYFINRTATRILDLTHGMLVNYIGNYDYYLEKRDELTRAALESRAMAEAQPGTSSMTSSSAVVNSIRSADAQMSGPASQTTASGAAAHTPGVASEATASGTASAESNAYHSSTSPVQTSTGSKNDWKAQKEEAAQQRKKQNAINRVEKEISQLEDRCAEIDNEFMKPEISTDPEKLRELTEEQKAAKSTLEELYAQWEELSE